MPTFRHHQTYEIHRPLTMQALAYQTVATMLMNGEAREVFLRAKRGAGGKTAGPLMVGPSIGCTNGRDLEQLYWESLKEGLDPCFVDKDGLVYIGGGIFVPTTRSVVHQDADILTLEEG